MRDTRFKRGQIWWIEGYEVHKEGGKRRPALIISNDDINGNMLNEDITIIPITSKTERLDIETNIVFDRHTRAKNVLKCAEITTIYKSQMYSYESALDDEAMEEVEKAVRIALGLENKIVKEKIEEVQEIEIENIKVEPPFVDEKESNSLEDYQIKKMGTKIKWNAENEALFMKIYTSEGIEKVCEVFETNKDNVNNRAFILSQKYPEFKTIRSKKE